MHHILINTAKHSATRQAPAFLMFGFHPRGPVEIREMKTNAPPATKRATQLAEARKETELLLKRAQIQYERWYNRGRTRKEFVEGDVVLFFIYKEHQATKAQCETVRYFGPFPVLNVIGDSKLAYDWICPSGFACTTSSSSPPWSRRRADLAPHATRIRRR